MIKKIKETENLLNSTKVYFDRYGNQGAKKVQ